MMRLLLMVILGLLTAAPSFADTWQERLQATFPQAPVVETFDELNDWTPGGQYFSAAGCPTCASNLGLPTKTTGGASVWSFWNNKGVSMVYTPGVGTFVAGDVITGASSAATATIKRVWNIRGKNYLQLTANSGVQNVLGFAAGENISSGTKTGTNIQWPKFIANHGTDYVWRGSGKSLAMDMGDNETNTTPGDTVTMEGLGAQRMGTYWGTGSSSDGFKKVNIFYMTKFNSQTIAPCPAPYSGCVQGGYAPVSVMKIFDLDTGFTAPSIWGSPAEASQASWGSVNDYGENFGIYNLAGGGSSYPNHLFFVQNNIVSTPPNTVTYMISNGAFRTPAGSNPANIAVPPNVEDPLDIESYMANNQWFGLEIESDVGTTGSYDGYTKFWTYYYNNGVLTTNGPFISPNGELKKTNFNHFYNKFVVGGNRKSGGKHTGDQVWWVDDLVIQGSSNGTDTRIGPAYFQALTSYNSGAPSPDNGVCDPVSSGQILPNTPTALCTIGTPSAVTLNGSTYSWTCEGLNGGSTASCTASRAAAGTSVVKASFKCNVR